MVHASRQRRPQYWRRKGSQPIACIWTFLIRSQTLLGPYLAPALIVTCVLLVVAHVGSRQPIQESSFPFARESPSTRRLINCLAYCAPGLFLFSRQSLDLIARQHVERVSYNRSGNVVTLVGPLLTTFCGPR